MGAEEGTLVGIHGDLVLAKHAVVTQLGHPLLEQLRSLDLWAPRGHVRSSDLGHSGRGSPSESERVRQVLGERGGVTFK